MRRKASIKALSMVGVASFLVIPFALNYYSADASYAFLSKEKDINSLVYEDSTSDFEIWDFN